MLKPLGYANGTVCDLEQARGLNFNGAIVLVDGRRVNSYDELVQIANEEINNNRQPIDVVILPAVTGG
jgi:hypothetical protein